MQDQNRAIATGIIWGAVTLITLVTGIFADESLGLVVFIALAAACISMGAIWTSAGASSSNSAAQSSSEKAKRSSRDRIARLVQEMDDGELQELGDILEGRDARR